MSAAAIKAFATRHPRTVALVEVVGGGRIRIVLCAPGQFGDVMADSPEQAAAWCAEAGVELGEWDRERAAQIAVSDADRRAMAGSGR